MKFFYLIFPKICTWLTFIFLATPNTVLYLDQNSSAIEPAPAAHGVICRANHLVTPYPNPTEKWPFS